MTIWLLCAVIEKLPCFIKLPLWMQWCNIFCVDPCLVRVLHGYFHVIPGSDGNISSEPATEPKKLQTTGSKYIQSKHCSTINGHLRLDVKSETMPTDCCYFKAEIKVYSLEQF